MQVTSDVLVIGSGIAGLTSALAAAESGLKVTLACCGCGTYSISSGCIDLLGQLEQNYVEDPWAAMFQLPEDHPYRLIGQENIKQALHFFSQILERQGGSFKVACDEALNPKNTLLPNILGTFKPSYLIPESLDSTPLFTAQKVLICGVEGLRDMSSKLVRDNLALNSQFKNTKFIATNLPNPEASSRSLTALDLARLVNTQAGWEWLSTSLGKYAQSFDCVLLPPICGTSKHHQVLKDLKALLGFPVEELLTIPPGVGGLRLHELLLKEARPLKIRFLENTQICQSLVETNHCLKVATAETQNLEITAKAYVLATGGILGGGLNLTPTQAIEPIFQIKQAIDPRKIRREKVLEPQPLAKLGLKCDHQLHPFISQDKVLENVFLAGKIIAGYDYSSEKSGHGVAISTGWLAGTLAAKVAKKLGGVA